MYSLKYNLVPSRSGIFIRSGSQFCHPESLALSFLRVWTLFLSFFALHERGLGLLALEFIAEVTESS